MALSACNSILGIGQIHTAGDDAGGADAGGTAANAGGVWAEVGIHHRDTEDTEKIKMQSSKPV